MTPPEAIETLADLEEALGAVCYRAALPDNAPLEVILAGAAGEERVPEWNLLSEINHLLDASLVRCAVNDDDPSEEALTGAARERLEAAWRTARLVGFKVRSLEALHRMRTRELEAEIHVLREGEKPRPAVSMPEPIDALDPDAQRDPDGGDTERHLDRCLDLARADCEEINRTFGSCSPEYAPLARLLWLARAMIREQGDHGGPRIAAKIAEAADVLEFDLANLRVEREAAAASAAPAG